MSAVDDGFVDDLPEEEEPPEENALDSAATLIVNNMHVLKIGLAAAALGLTWVERRKFRKQLEQVSRDVKRLGR